MRALIPEPAHDFTLARAGIDWRLPADPAHGVESLHLRSDRPWLDLTASQALRHGQPLRRRNGSTRIRVKS